MSVTYGQCDARPTDTFPAAWRQRNMCVSNLPRVALDSGAAEIQTRESHLWPIDRKFITYRYATEPHSVRSKAAKPDSG